MPGDIVGELAGGIVRAAGRIIGEIILHLILELAVQGVGYLICKPFKPGVKADGGLVTLVGFSFWLVILISAYGACVVSCGGRGCVGG